jgi:hypothetical protein
MFGNSSAVEWLATCQEGLSSNLRILGYQAEILSRITRDTDQQSWCHVAAYKAENRMSNLKLHESLGRNATCVHPCGVSQSVSISLSLSLSLTQSHTHNHTHTHTHTHECLELLQANVTTLLMCVTAADSLCHCYIRRCFRNVVLFLLII